MELCNLDKNHTMYRYAYGMVVWERRGGGHVGPETVMEGTKKF